MGVVLPSLDKRNRGECGLRGSFDGTGDLGGGEAGGGRPEGWGLQPFRLPLSVLDDPTDTGCEGPVCISPSLGKLGGKCKCGEGEFTPKAAFQNLGQSLGIPERRGKDYLFLGEEEGHRGEGRG